MRAARLDTGNPVLQRRLNLGRKQPIRARYNTNSIILLQEERDLRLQVHDFPVVDKQMGHSIEAVVEVVSLKLTAFMVSFSLMKK